MKKTIKRTIAVIAAFVGILALVSANDESLATIVVPAVIAVASFFVCDAILKHDNLEEYE